MHTSLYLLNIISMLNFFIASLLDFIYCSQTALSFSILSIASANIISSLVTGSLDEYSIPSQSGVIMPYSASIYESEIFIFSSNVGAKISRAPD